MGSLPTDLIVILPKSKRELDYIITKVDILNRKVQLIPSHGSDTAVGTAY